MMNYEYSYHLISELILANINECICFINKLIYICIRVKLHLYRLIPFSNNFAVLLMTLFCLCDGSVSGWLD